LAGQARAHREQSRIPRVDEPVGPPMANEKNSLSRNAVVLLVALVAGGAGPRMTAPHDKPAGGPFDYQAPEGFRLAPEEATRLVQGELKSAQRVWVLAKTEARYAPNITLTHTESSGMVEEPDMARLAK